MPENRVFEGFHKPTYTMVPDEVFDNLLDLLTGAELKVLLYIIRRTFGFRKESDSISLSQLTDGIVKRDGTVLDRGAGVSKTGAVEAVKGLVAKGCLLAESQTDERGGFAPTVYRLRFTGMEPASTPSTENGQGLTGKRSRGLPKSEQPLDRKTAIQNTDVQETENNMDSGADEQEHEETDDGPPPPYSPWIADVIVDYSRELGDSANVEANSRRAMRLWQRSGLREEDFVARLHAARIAARKTPGRGWAAMDRFFRVLLE